MPEPKSNDRLIDAMVKQFHSGAVAQGMRGHPLAGEAWAGTRSSQTVFADQMFQGITREWIATDGREQRPIIVAAPFFQPVLQGLGGIPTKRSEEHTSELQSLMRISYAVFCFKQKN